MYLLWHYLAANIPRNGKSAIQDIQRLHGTACILHDWNDAFALFVHIIYGRFYAVPWQH